MIPNSRLSAVSCRSSIPQGREIMKTNTTCFGIDVSKAKLHLATSKKFCGEFNNDVDGHQKIIDIIQQHETVHVVLEASGGYEFLVCQAMHAVGITLTVAQPSCVRYFAKSVRVLAKTDRIDAKIIARFGEATSPAPTTPPRKNVGKIRALCVRRQQIVDDRVRESNRLEACSDPDIREDLSKSVDQLLRREEQLTKEIDAILATDEVFREKAKVMEQLKGVGPKTINTLLAWLPELGTLTRQEIAALAGLAPYAQESGTFKGKRTIFGGRAAVRRAMYLAARTAARWCPVISEVYKRHRENGKPYNVAIIACARKMLVRLNSLIKQMDTENQVPNEAITT